MPPNDEKGIPQDRVKIIETVQTPLGFFALVVLVVEVILGVLADGSTGSDRTIIKVALDFVFPNTLS